MAKALPSIQTLSACPFCGCAEFFVKQRYSGQGCYNRQFNGQPGASNGQMYDCLNVTVGKTAFCCGCGEPVARWDEDADGNHYQN